MASIYLDGERETRGHAPGALTWRTPEGIDVKPLYTAADLEGLAVDAFAPRLSFFFGIGMSFFMLFRRHRAD